MRIKFIIEEGTREEENRSRSILNYAAGCFCFVASALMGINLTPSAGLAIGCGLILSAGIINFFLGWVIGREKHV